MNDASSFSIETCYAAAWKSFSKWWIPLCLLAAFLLFFHWLPRHFSSSSEEAQQFAQTLADLSSTGGATALEAHLPEVMESLSAYVQKWVKLSLMATPFVALLGVLIIATSLMAVRDQRCPLAPLRLLGVSVFQLLLSVVKMLLLIAIFPLGLFVYIKLYFATLFMLDGEPPLEAISKSWKITTGHFGGLFLLLFLNTLIQFFAGITVIGFLPATGFVATARATAFSMLNEPKNKSFISELD